MADKRLKPLSSGLKRSLEIAVSKAEKNIHLAEEWLQARGLDLPTAIDHRLGVVVDPIPGQSEHIVGRLSIPFLGPAGPVYIQYRQLPDGAGVTGDGAKYLGWTGSAARIYGIRSLLEADDVIHVAEGPLDSVVLNSLGLVSVGIPGAQRFEKHWPRVFAGFSKVVIWADGDDAGRQMAKKWTQEIDQAVVVPMPSGEDVNSLLVKDGPEAIHQLLKQALADE